MMPYSAGIAPYYDLFAGPADPADPAAAFLSGFVGAEDSVLDIGAGTGVTAVALAERGVHVAALEPDPEMYAVLLSRLARRFDVESRITPIPRKAGFRTGQQYDVCCCFAVLHLLAPAEQEEVVAYAKAEVKPGGKIILDIPVHSSERMPRPSSLVSTRSLGRLRVEHRSSMEMTGGERWRTHWSFVSYLDNVQVHEIQRTFDWSPLSDEDIDALLLSHGLKAIAEFAGYDRRPYERGKSRTRLVVAVEA
jgi:SAM-dependent methyltransferase